MHRVIASTQSYEVAQSTRLIPWLARGCAEQLEFPSLPLPSWGLVRCPEGESTYSVCAFRRAPSPQVWSNSRVETRHGRRKQRKQRKPACKLGIRVTFPARKLLVLFYVCVRASRCPMIVFAHSSIQVSSCASIESHVCLFRESRWFVQLSVLT